MSKCKKLYLMFFNVCLFLISNTIAKSGCFCDTAFRNNDTIVRCSVYTSNGDLIRLRQYLNGKEHGEQTEWYNGKILKAKRNYDKGCRKDSSYSYYKNGKLETIVYCKECSNWYSLSFYENGDTASISTPLLFQSYYKNKNRNVIINYNQQGQKHGLSQAWREDGTRKDSVVYANDTIIEMCEYFLNGKVRHWFKLCRGTNTTEAYFYHADGNSAGKVKGGNGTVTSYTESAERRFSDRYENGVMVESKEIK